MIQRTLVLFVASALALGTAAAAQAPGDGPQDRPAPPAPQQPAQTQQQTAQGELVSVDAKASTLTIKGSSGEMTFRYDEQTKVTGAQKGVAGLATMKGADVVVQYRKDGAANIATSIEVRPGQAPGE